MPQLIQHIDAIARQKQRDVLAVEFHEIRSSFKAHWLANEARKTICNWLDENDISYYPCGPFANAKNNTSYHGQIYLDIPYDDANTCFLKVKAYLENSDGTTKFKGAKLIYYPLVDVCLKNANHNEPKF